MLAGLKGYEGRRIRAKLEERGLHQTRVQMRLQRDISVILGRQDWFNRERYDNKALLDIEEDERPTQRRGSGQWRAGGRRNNTKQ